MARIYRLHKLWKAAGGPGLPPSVDTRRIKAKVSAALAAGQPGQSGQSEQSGQTERNIYFMKNIRNQRLGTAALAAALLLVITGTAFAAFVNRDPFAAWFKGDTSPGQEYLDSEIRSVSDENYTLTVENSVADENVVYLTVSVTALSDEAKEFICSDDFMGMDTFSALTPADLEEDADTFHVRGMGIRKLDSEMENCRRFALDVSLVSPADTLLVRCGWMEKGLRVRVPVAPAPSVTVKIDASGTGVRACVPNTNSSMDATPLTIREITLTPFTCRMKLTRMTEGWFADPNILLRLKDGSIRTQSQMMDHTDGTLEKARGNVLMYEENYRFYKIQDLENIFSVIAFDMEYPLDGSAPFPAEHDPSLDPFTLPMHYLEDGTYAVPVRALTERLGGTYSWDAAKEEASCTYRGVAIVLRAGSRTAFVDGEAVEMHKAPEAQDGGLVALVAFFQDAWGLGGGVLHEDIEIDGEWETAWGDWYVVP